MTVPRASYGMLRNHIRPASARRAAPLGVSPSPRHQTQVRYDGNLGGPGGQQPPPNKPGGPEAVSRNWVPIGGSLLALAAAYAYFTTPKSTLKEAERGSAQEASKLSDDAKALGQKIGQEVKDQSVKTASELSGRKKTEHGGFRAE